MMLLLLLTEAACLDQQHRRTAYATSNGTGAGVLTANSGLVLWPGRVNVELKLAAVNRSSKAGQQGKF
jgi:hypothetical protein